MTAARQPGPTFATYLDRHDRNQLDAEAACARQERDDALDDLQEARRQIAELTAKLEDRRIRLRDADNDLLNVRGILSPNGYPQRVPVDLVPTVAPAVQWLADRVDTLTAERDEARAELEQAQRQTLTEASNLLWAWAEEMGDVGGTGLRAARKRTIKACARKIAPEPTDDEMRAALAELLGGMADRAKAASPPGLGSPADRAQDERTRIEEAIEKRLREAWPNWPIDDVWLEQVAAQAAIAAVDAKRAEKAEG